MPINQLQIGAHLSHVIYCSVPKFLCYQKYEIQKYFNWKVSFQPRMKYISTGCLYLPAKTDESRKQKTHQKIIKANRGQYLFCFTILKGYLDSNLINNFNRHSAILSSWAFMPTHETLSAHIQQRLPHGGRTGA